MSTPFARTPRGPGRLVRRPGAAPVALLGAAAALLLVALDLQPARAGAVAPTRPALAGAGGPKASHGAPARLPARLSGTGLYSDPGRLTVAPDVLPFTPQYPLWTDGAAKRRWIRLPAGSSIDASDPDAWRFPIGTKLWKEFAFGRPVETRYMELGADGVWVYGTYLWNEEGTDAPLAPECGARRVCESRPGTPYDVPSRADCLACHDGRATPVLGFSALQLSSDRDPLAPHREEPREGDVDLEALVDRGLVSGLPAGLASRPPRIDAPTPTARAALGYLHGNCGACHAESTSLAPLGLLLEYRLGPGQDPADAVETTVGRPSSFRFGAPAEQEVLRIAPGAPEHSALLRRMASRNPIAQMPPLGSRVADAAGIALVEAWIREDLAPPPSIRATTLPH